MNRIYVTILLLAIVSSQNINAQANFVDGYVLLSEYDTLYGKINNVNYYYNGHTCDLLNPKTDSITKYSPEDIFGYRFADDKFYVSRQVGLHKEKVFLEFLINGKLDVYFYQEENGDNHYLVSKDTLPLRELNYSENIENIDGKLALKGTKDYVGILNYLTYECPEMQADILNLHRPDHQNLIKLAKKYHSKVCEEEECTIYRKKMYHQIRVDIQRGVTLFKQEIKDFDSQYPSYGANVYMQAAQTNENMYLGLGVFSEGFIRTPLSINYINSRQGFSPFFTYEIDLGVFYRFENFMVTQALELGIKYQLKKISIVVHGDVKTVRFYRGVYGYAVNLGLMYDLR